ncbi:GbsR/MarR family transcriptional regulator [Sporosarcina sp. CAU 1771]
MDGTERLENARKRITESIAQNIHLYGLPPSAGRQYGTMFFQNKPTTLDDMSEKLGMSKTSMSTSSRALTEAKLVERVWERGVRKDLYEVKDDWYQSFIDTFTNKWGRSVSLHTAAIRRSLSEIEQLIEDDTISPEVLAEAKIDLEKLNYIKNYYAWLGRLIKAFETHEIFDLVPMEDE